MRSARPRPMDKEEIIRTLDSTHAELNAMLANTSKEDLQKAPDGKWNGLEHVVHLNKALSALAKGLRRPKFLLRYSFGRPNRAPRDYQEVKERYHSKLAAVQGAVNSPFGADDLGPLKKEEVLQRFEENQKKLLNSLRKWKDPKLNAYLLPHPLMGKLTVMEMLYFMDFHTRHHMESIRELSA